MSLPIYSGTRSAEGVEVYVTRDGFRKPLPPLTRHSPDGFEWGYGGSGPLDLARSIVGDYMGTGEPDDAYTHSVLTQLIAGQATRGWTLVPADLHKAFRLADCADRTPVKLGRVVVTRMVDHQLLRHPDGQTFIDLCLIRHERGDWGVLDEHDTDANTAALHHGGRLLSNYPIPEDVCPDALKDATRLWIITEASDGDGHRLATTVLYPTEY